MLKFNQLVLRSAIVPFACLVLFSSCRRLDRELEKPLNAVNLSPEVETKGGVVTTSNILEFVSFGYSQEYNDWVDVKTTASANLMWNNKYSKSGSDWVGDIATQWPSSGEFKRYSFFAYSPKAAADNGLTLTSVQSTVGYQKLSYQTVQDVTKHVDLVIAERLNQTQVQEVPLSFKHALTRVGFTAYSDKPGVTIKSISINGVKYKGDIEMRKDALWTNVSSDKANFEATINSGELSQDIDAPTSLVGSNGEGYFMLLPQDLSANVDNAICISVVKTWKGSDKTLNYIIKQNYEKGKAVLYKLFIKNGVDLIVDWGVTEWGNQSVGGDANGSYLNLSVINDKEAGDASIIYSADYTGAVTCVKKNAADPVTITHNAANKTFILKATTIGVYDVVLTAGSITRELKIAWDPSYIPTAVLSAAGWPADKLPAIGLQVAMKGDKQLPVTGTLGADPELQWKTSNTTTPGTSDVLGTGKANTAAMAGAEHPAAQYCRDMGPQWYLPSSRELSLIYTNRSLLGPSYTFVVGSHWSSTEFNSSNSWLAGYPTINIYDDAKSNNNPVRCVREINLPI